MPDWSYRTVFQPLLFRLPFETARDMALGAMGRLSRMPFGTAVIDFMGHMRPADDLSRRSAGLEFSSPVGLGCTVDVHGVATRALAQFGAGFVEVGPIALERLVSEMSIQRRDDLRALRLPKNVASDGLEVWQQRLSTGGRADVRCLARLVVPSEMTPDLATSQCLDMVERLRDRVDGFVIATSDTALHSMWTQAEWQTHLASLVAYLSSTARSATECDTSGSAPEPSLPLWIAVRADLDHEQFDFIGEAALAAGCCGTVVDGRVADLAGSGWLVGQVAFEPTRRAVIQLRQRFGDELSIIAGGVHEPVEALELLRAGANLTLVDAGLVYSGPGLLKRINEAVLFEGQIFAEQSGFNARIECEASRRGQRGSRPALDLTRWTWFWTCLLGLGLFLGGSLALGIASTRVILPYDEVFIGMSREELNLISPRLLAFMQHDRVTLSGTMLSVAVLYLSLSWYGIRRGAHWAMMTVLVSALTGFVSFFLFLGFGYFDPFHAFVTAVMFQFLLMAWSANLGPVQRTSLPNLREDRAWRLAQWGQLVFVIHAAILIVAGTVICGIGCTTVFVQEDLDFMEVCPSDLSLANPRLIPLIAHDRASFGGMLITTGMVVLLTSLWGLRQGARWLWWMLLLAGLPAYGLAIGVHQSVGYTSSWHLVPAYGGLAVLVLGLALLWPHVGRRDLTHEREWSERFRDQASSGESANDAD